MSAVDFDFSGIGIRIRGLPEPLAEQLGQEWASFRGVGRSAPFLGVAVSCLGGEGEAAPFRPKEMASELRPGRARFEMPRGRVDVEQGGVARLRLSGPHDATAYWTMVNLLRACIAWSLPARGAALLHAAGLVVEGRAYLLVGPEGSGKTTWARIGEEHGARPLSDDLVLVECGAGGAEALGSPFRSTLRRDYRPGRWPLAAILFPARGKPPELRPCTSLLSRARLAANLPFISDAIEVDVRVAALVERLATGVRCRELRFAPDPTFLELLREDGGADG